MTSPLLRLFAVFWWLLVLGSVAAVIWLSQTTWDDFVFGWAQFGLHITLRNLFVSPTGSGPPMLYDFAEEALRSGLLFCLLPYPALTFARWITTGRWRFGPRW
jgi:hypothetical protein